MSNPLLKANTTGIKTTLIKEGGFSKELKSGPYYNANDILLKAIKEGIEKDGNYSLIAKNEYDPSDDIYQDNLAQRDIENTTEQVKQLNFNYNENGIQIGDDNTKGVFWEKPAYFSDDCTYYPLGSNGRSMDSLMLASSRKNGFLNFNYEDLEDPTKTLKADTGDLVSINSKNKDYDNNIWGDYRGIQISKFQDNLLKFKNKKDSISINLEDDGSFDKIIELSEKSFDHIEIIHVDEEGIEKEALKEGKDFKVIEKKNAIEVKNLKKTEASSLKATLYTYEISWTSCWENKNIGDKIVNNFLLAEDALKIKPSSSSANCYFQKEIDIKEEGYYSFSCYMKANKDPKSANNFEIKLNFKKDHSASSEDSNYFSELSTSSNKSFLVDTEWRRYGIISYLKPGSYYLEIQWPHDNYNNIKDPSLSIMALKLEKGFFSNYDFRDVSYIDNVTEPKKHILGFHWDKLLEKSNWAITYLRYIPGINNLPEEISTQRCVDTIGVLNLGYEKGKVIVSEDWTPVTKAPTNLEPYNRWERVLLEYNNNILTYTVLGSNDLGKESYFYAYKIPFEKIEVEKVFANDYKYNLLLGADLDENNEINTYNAFYRGLAFFDCQLTESQKHDVLYTYMKLDYVEGSKIALKSEHLTETDITNLK